MVGNHTFILQKTCLLLCLRSLEDSSTHSRRIPYIWNPHYIYECIWYSATCFSVQGSTNIHVRITFILHAVEIKNEKISKQVIKELGGGISLNDDESIRDYLNFYSFRPLCVFSSIIVLWHLALKETSTFCKVIQNRRFCLYFRWIPLHPYMCTHLPPLFSVTTKHSSPKFSVF